MDLGKWYSLFCNPPKACGVVSMVIDKPDTSEKPSLPKGVFTW
jgi:hypothetical protein